MSYLKNKNTIIVIVSFFTLVFPFTLGVYLDGAYSAFKHIPLHSVLEASGAIMAFTVSMFIFIMYKAYLRFGHFHWTGVALIGMGIFDFFHAFMYPGELFVWFHSIAVFVGGLLFSLVWIKEIEVSHKTYYMIPVVITIISIFVSIVSLVFPGMLPRMIVDGHFSDTSIFLNIVGGLGFVVAGVNFLLRYHRYGEADEILFAGHTFLFGVSGLLFATSYIWEPSWWLWHFLRFFAYLIAIYYTFILFSRKSDLLYKEKKILALNLAEKSEQLLAQSRMAQMGEMISMIAHQWRQPLGAIAATNIDLRMKIELEIFDLEIEKGREEFKNYFIENSDHVASYVENLTNTIDDFRNFYKPNKSYTQDMISKPVDQALGIIQSSLDSKGVEIIKVYESKTLFDLYVNELMQVVLNILKNAQDNFKEKNIKNAKIMISTKDYSDKSVLEICDNGGGIEEDVLSKIFDPYFSTKDDKNGTGLGLYMSKTIVEDHHNGKLDAFNKNEGVCFCIEVRDRIS